MSWKDLDIKQKAELIKLGVQSGIRDIKQIRQLYNDNNTPTQVVDQSYNETNVKPLQGIERIVHDYGIPEEEVNKANDIIQQIEKEIILEEINNQQPIQFRQFKNGGYKDNPPFIQRILNNDKRSVKDWQNNDYQATHKLSYAQTPEGYIVYPEVQEVNGQLHDFTDPKYKHSKWDALDNAIRNNDTLRFSTEEQALKYTQEYKNKYPEYFKQFNKGGYISNNPTQALVGKVNKFKEGGYDDEDENKNINSSILGRYVQSKISQNTQENQEQPIIITNEPVSESTYVQQPSLNIHEQELLNYLQSDPTAEQKYFRNLAVQNMTAPQYNQGVIYTKEEQDLVDKAFQGYNNFRYSHPWAKGLSYTPIIGDGMDLISLAGAVNNKDYMTAGLGLGMLALPNFIEKPIKNYKKAKRRYKSLHTEGVKSFFGESPEKDKFIYKTALLKYPDLSKPFDKSLAQLGSDEYKDLVNGKIEGIQRNTLSLYKNLSNKDYGRLANIINLSPEYGIFLQQNPTLNPLSQNTLDKFFERQSISIRGVTADNDNIAQQYLNTPPPQSIGGDRLDTKGLYTSNSFDIADAFSRPQTHNQQSSYIGKIQYPFEIDKKQSFENQLKQYRSYIDHYYDLGLRNRIPGTIAKEATYVRGNGNNYYNITERSYYPKEENSKKIVDILELQNRGQLQNLHGRWGNSNMIPDSEYFIPKYPNNSLSDYITFMRAATKEGKFRGTDINEIKRWKEQQIINDIITNQEKKRGDLYIKAYNKYKKNIQKPLDILYKGSVISGVVSLPILAAYSVTRPQGLDVTNMSEEDLNQYINLIDEVHNKTGIRKNKLYKMPLYRLQRYLKEEEYKNGGFLFPNQAFSHKFEK